MSDAATIAYWIGTAGSAVFTVLFAYWTLYPRREGNHKVALWALAPAIASVIVQGGLLIDLGSTLRDDSVEFNYARFVAYAISAFCASAIAGAYLWCPFVEGWWIMTFSTAYVITLTLSGLATGDRRWPLFACAMLFGVAYLVYLFWKPTFFAYSHSDRSRSSKFMSWVYAIGYALALALIAATHLFSDALIGSMSFPLKTWLYAGCTLATVGLPIIPAFDYHPQPSSKTD